MKNRSILLYLTLIVSLLQILDQNVTGAAIPRRPEQLKFKPLQYTPPQPQQFRHELKSGPVAYVVPDHTTPLVQIEVYVKAGSYLEPTNLIGLAAATAELLTTGGTTTWPADQLDEHIDFLGATLSSTCNALFARIHISILTNHLEEGINILREVLSTPAFQEDRIELYKRRTINQMAQRNDDSAEIEWREAQFLAYGTNTWMSALPTRQTIEAITKQDLVAFHHRWYWPSNFVLAISGDIDTNQIVQKLESIFSTWPYHGEFPQPPPTNFHFAPPAVYLVDKKVNQTRVRILIPGVIKWGDPDQIAAMVMNDIFGGSGLTSRLFNKIRSDEGLAYSVRSTLTVDPLFPRPFQIALQTKSRTTAHAIALTLQEIEKIRSENVSDKELQLAKESLIGRLSDYFATPATIASTFAQDEILGRFQKTPHFWQNLVPKIQSVTKKDVQKAAARILNTNHIVILLVGDKSEIIRGHPDYKAQITNLLEGRLVELPLRDPFTLLPMPNTPPESPKGEN